MSLHLHSVADYQRAVLAWHAVQVTRTALQREHVIDLWFEGCEFRVESTPHPSDQWDNRNRKGRNGA
ncbi:MAG TPA: hypothetical protein VGH47_15980 [Xanthobacteraceae bacterium]|jgi:hypothetical protein